MEHDEYTSAELCDIANAAPIDTIEETIEGLTQKQIAGLQMEFYEYVHQCIAKVDCYTANAMKRYKLSKADAEAFVWECIEKTFETRRAVLNQSIEALHALTRYRIDGYQEWTEKVA